MAQRSPLFVRKQAGGMFAVVDETKGTGNIWFADSGSATGGDTVGHGQNPDTPFLTWDYAVGMCSENNGDIIKLMPGHAETLTTAGAVTLDKAGVTTIGMGEGASRPTFTFSSTDNSASVLITAASTKIKNIIGICGDDGLTNPFHVQAADCELDITWRDASSTVEAACAILTTAAADRLKVKLKYEGQTGGDACVNAIRCVGVDEGDITVDFYGLASTGIVEFKTTACTGIQVRGYFYNSGTTDLTKNIVNTGGIASTWFATGYDGAAGQSFSGGSGAAIAGDDISTIASLVGTADLTTTDNLHGKLGTDTEMADRSVYDLLNGGGPAAAATAAAPANDVSLYGAVRYIVETLLGGAEATTTDLINGKLGTDTELADRSLYDIVNGGGPVAAATAAAPANDVSLYAIVRDAWDAIRNGTGGSEPGTNKSLVDAIGFNGAAAVTSSAGMLRTAASTKIIVSKNLTGTDIDSATATDVTAVSTVGEILVEEIILEADDALTDATNLNVLVNGNDYGLATIAAEAIANLGANTTVQCTAASVTALVPFVLEVGSKIQVQSTVMDVGAGLLKVTIIGSRMADGANLTAAA